MRRVDISRLSKGERQIFILSLYWAIIELSGQDIPFIIDTPYARIDANHRKEISEKFFPTKIQESNKIDLREIMIALNDVVNQKDNWVEMIHYGAREQDLLHIWKRLAIVVVCRTL